MLNISSSGGPRISLACQAFAPLVSLNYSRRQDSPEGGLAPCSAHQKRARVRLRSHARLRGRVLTLLRAPRPCSFSENHRTAKAVPPPVVSVLLAGFRPYFAVSSAGVGDVVRGEEGDTPFSPPPKLRPRSMAFPPGGASLAQTMTASMISATGRWSLAGGGGGVGGGGGGGRNSLASHATSGGSSSQSARSSFDRQLGASVQVRAPAAVVLGVRVKVGCGCGNGRGGGGGGGGGAAAVARRFVEPKPTPWARRC